MLEPIRSLNLLTLLFVLMSLTTSRLVSFQSKSEYSEFITNNCNPYSLYGQLPLIAFDSEVNKSQQEILTNDMLISSQGTRVYLNRLVKPKLQVGYATIPTNVMAQIDTGATVVSMLLVNTKIYIVSKTSKNSYTVNSFDLCDPLKPVLLGSVSMFADDVTLFNTPAYPSTVYMIYRTACSSNPPGLQIGEKNAIYAGFNSIFYPSIIKYIGPTFINVVTFPVGFMKAPSYMTVIQNFPTRIAVGISGVFLIESIRKETASPSQMKLFEDRSSPTAKKAPTVITRIMRIDLLASTAVPGSTSSYLAGGHVDNNQIACSRDLLINKASILKETTSYVTILTREMIYDKSTYVGSSISLYILDPVKLTFKTSLRHFTDNVFKAQILLWPTNGPCIWGTANSPQLYCVNQGNMAPLGSKSVESPTTPTYGVTGTESDIIDMKILATNKKLLIAVTQRQLTFFNIERVGFMAAQTSELFVDCEACRLGGGGNIMVLNRDDSQTSQSKQSYLILAGSILPSSRYSSSRAGGFLFPLISQQSSIYPTTSRWAFLDHNNSASCAGLNPVLYSTLTSCGDVVTASECMMVKVGRNGAMTKIAVPCQQEDYNQ